MADVSKILVTGAGGVIGTALPFGIKIAEKELNVNDEKNIRKVCDKAKPSGILCLSSVNIRKCLENPFEAYKVNVLGVYNVAKECARRKIPIIYLSSGTLFNGPKNKVFEEDSEPNPQNIYGQSKYIAEILIKDSGADYIIARTGWLFGFPLNKEKQNPFDKMLQKIVSGENVKATINQTGSPTYAPDFFDKLKELIEKNKFGVYHIANSGNATAAEFAREANKILGNKAVIEELSQQELDSRLKRSESEALSSKKIKLRSWKESLKEYFNSWK